MTPVVAPVVAPGAAGGPAIELPQRLRYLNAGFLWQSRLRRILALAGTPMLPGLPAAGDAVAVWGRSPYAARGERAAVTHGAALWRIEDAFLRSLHPGRAGGPPLGLLIDRRGGVHFDAALPSDLETILARDPLDDTALLDRARAGMARMSEADLSKYTAHDPDLALPPPGYVLVIDQTRGDASVRASGGDAATFRDMLTAARTEHPGVPVVIKTHPETAQGFRPGHFDASDAQDGVTVFTALASPGALLDGARAVYTLSSQMGFDAILAGHCPQVFGTPFYAGWGLSVDRSATPLPRRGRTLTRAQLFAGAMILAPTWYDPFHDRLASFEDALETLAAETRAWREDRNGWTATGMRAWKRAHLQRFYGHVTPVRFGPPRPSRRAMVWGAMVGDAMVGDAMVGGGQAADATAVLRVEDGFLRSRGLGAALVPPLSLVLDSRGIYYDPRTPSDLDHLIAARARLRPDQALRAERLIRRLIAAGVSKYNLGGTTPALPDGYRILVPGQVEDDASIRLGCGDLRTNRALLQAARAANPDAILIYKPHPDVVAGLRPGALPDAETLADLVLPDADIAALLGQVQGVWTLTSLTGFEALLRGVPVTTLGTPFYAGWGLTRHLGPKIPHRAARPTLAGLVHAALIDYPRYLDPLTGRPCPVEVAVDRLISGAATAQGPGLRVLAKLQGWLAGYAHLWR